MPVCVHRETPLRTRSSVPEVVKTRLHSLTANNKVQVLELKQKALRKIRRLRNPLPRNRLDSSINNSRVHTSTFPYHPPIPPPPPPSRPPPFVWTPTYHQPPHVPHSYYPPQHNQPSYYPPQHNKPSLYCNPHHIVHLHHLIINRLVPSLLLTPPESVLPIISVIPIPFYATSTPTSTSTSIFLYLSSSTFYNTTNIIYPTSLLQ